MTDSPSQIEQLDFRWSYTLEESRRYADQERRSLLRFPWLSTVLFLFALTGVGLGIAAKLHLITSLFFCAVLLAIFLGIVLTRQMDARDRLESIEQGLPDTVFDTEGLTFLGKDYHWRHRRCRLRRVELLAADDSSEALPLLRFTFLRPSYHCMAPVTVRVPIPEGREAEAGQVIEMLSVQASD